MALSLLLAWLGTVVNFVDFNVLIHENFARNADAYRARGVMDPYPLIRWDWRFAPIYRYWNLPLKDYLLLPHALHTPGLVAGWFALVAAGCVAGTARLVAAVRRLP